MTWNRSTRRQRLPANWRQLRLRVLARDAHRCQIQGPRCILIATEVDHVVPNDDHSPSNLRAACRVCHASKSANEGVASRATIAARGKRPPEPHPGLR